MLHSCASAENPGNHSLNSLGKCKSSDLQIVRSLLLNSAIKPGMRTYPRYLRRVGLVIEGPSIGIKPL